MVAHLNNNFDRGFRDSPDLTSGPQGGTHINEAIYIFTDLLHLEHYARGWHFTDGPIVAQDGMLAEFLIV